MSQIRLHENWIWAKLGDLCLSVDNLDFSQRALHSFQYIDISSIDREQKLITYVERVNGIEAPSRARQIILKDDVLVSTVRPSLNAVAKVPENLNNEICSTGFCVLRANPDILDSDYLFAWVRSPIFIQSLTHVERGIGYPSVNNSDIENTQIPLPPLPEQQRIAEILREADEIRKLRKQANEKTQEIVSALFYEMFGDPTTWAETVPLQQCVDFVGGGTPNTKIREYFQGDIPWATSKDIKGSYLYNTQDHITQEAIENSSTRLVPTNTILIVVKSKILMHSLPMTITARPVCFGQDIKGLVCKEEFVPQFIVTSLAVQASRILESARGVNTEGLTLELLRDIPVPRVNTSLQKVFLENVTLVDDLMLEYKEARLYTEVLLQSLLAQAFNGELTATWRDAHTEILQHAAQERDRLLQERSRRLRVVEMERVPLVEQRVERRYELMHTLNPRQIAIVSLLNKHGAGYFAADVLHDDIDEHMDEQGQHRADSDSEGLYRAFEEWDYSFDTLRRELHFLAKLGLHKELTLAVMDASVEGIEPLYITVHRSLLAEDDSQQDDLVVLETLRSDAVLEVSP